MYPSSGIGYLVDGATDDWVYGKLGVAAYTYEIGPNYGSCGGFFPAYGCQDGIDGMTRNFWLEMRQSFVYAHKIAVSPYTTVYGPDSQNLTVSPTSIPAGEPIDLAGLVLDQRYAGDPLQPVSAAEYFIDAPGADGTGFPLDPTDGAWGETSEDVTAVVATDGLILGQHYILVHGLNDDGVWGPFTAVFVNIIGPAAPIADFSSNSPVLIGDPVLFENLTTGTDPITYTWDFGDGIGTSTETNPAYIYTNLGTYTVTLEATNYLGSDSISHPVSVFGIPIDTVELTLLTTAPVYTGDSADFSADLLPDNATKPYSYTIDFGDETSSMVHLSWIRCYFPTSTSHGDNTIVIDVWNDGMGVPVSDSLQLNVLVPIPVAEFTSNSPVLVGQPLQFTNQSIGSPTPTYL
jgi:PKD repeat protein